MTRITSISPPMPKQERAKPDPEYLAMVRDLPCVICEEWCLVQRTHTTAHYPIHGRYGSRKVPDRMAIPLCDCHHQGMLGASPERLAIHRDKRAWAEAYGLDTDFVLRTQERLGK